MGRRFFSTEEDDEKAYRTDEDMAGRSKRRGIDKGINATLNMFTMGIWGIMTADDPSEVDPDPSDAFTHLAKDAEKEYRTKYRPRTKEREE
ncbi:MAG: hypothetical protein AAF717_05655 [Bacteroidota bacterium]